MDTKWEDRWSEIIAHVFIYRERERDGSEERKAGRKAERFSFLILLRLLKKRENGKLWKMNQ